ncbi:hypothetical protein Kpol_1043p38 [Vanderwaltozyma polyspora DSM 70294]|uniref:Altered inheritance of mitochondria protein 19, mitochondrial n=1 Tax=Vanderwaltozyma polyspora (strain ATCC 22028 / DSM 70294 / BCRC 21397 / CBS 2163 / NBRC 10782 / NRRL Y-8283 / UCD 57-17) TaxID=436907 RepID=A7TIQ6_VANPO|nr:uncharacterized protein Kpol_1043p38 [Vanderwaltozyma polyspora DSM 70294]EDO17848.1 hypothetical protein Kpol_1043p38 [Vanderwaltozyma polyspora DSM 70294]
MNTIAMDTKPYLSLTNGLMLLSTPWVSPSFQVTTTVPKENTNLIQKLWSRQPTRIGPSTKISLLFGISQVLGSFMIYDGDLESGSGFIAAWSTTYLISQGRNSLQALKLGKVWPLMLTTSSLCNAYLYGKRYVSCQFK